MSKGFDIDIRIDELPGVAAALAAAPEIAMEELTAWVWEGSLLLQREAVENTPRGIGAGGGLAGSIIAGEPEVLADQVIGMVGSPLNYAVPVELGTKPHFPPLKPLQDWARHKLGLSPEQAEQAGRAIQRAIGRRGTKGAHMFGRAIETNEPQLRRMAEARGRRVADRLKALGGSA